MALKVIGAGFGRTGTLSLKMALEKLGFTKCYHMQEVMPSGKLRLWHAAAHGKPVDWEEIFEGYEACVDWPACTFWEELHQKYPESKVILSERDSDSWWKSAMQTIYPGTNEIPLWLKWMLPRIRRLSEMIRALIWDGTFDGRFEERNHAVDVFERHNEYVKKTCAPDRLLVFRATEGWEPLCAFLGVPVPAEPYPHVNEASNIKRFVKIMRMLRWLPHAVGAGLAIWLLLAIR